MSTYRLIAGGGYETKHGCLLTQTCRWTLDSRGTGTAYIGPRMSAAINPLEGTAAKKRGVSLCISPAGRSYSLGVKSDQLLSDSKFFFEPKTDPKFSIWNPESGSLTFLRPPPPIPRARPWSQFHPRFYRQCETAPPSARRITRLLSKEGSIINCYPLLRSACRLLMNRVCCAQESK